jgi:tetratricopeptide (TPR) repeat protein
MDSNSLDHEAPSEPTLAEINRSKTAKSGGSSEIDFFISRRGGAAAIAQEVADILKDEGYTVLVQDYDIAYTADFIGAMDDALKRCRHLIVLLTNDYTASKFTMMEVTNFLAAAGRTADERRLVVLRLDESEPEGILASRVYGNLVGISDLQERKARILAAAEGRSTATPRRHKLFENVAPRDLNFTGRDDRLTEIHRLLRNSDKQTSTTHVAIHGLGGIGKSSLAAEYAHRYAGEYSGVWWAPSEQRALLLSSLAILAGKLDQRLADESDQEKAAKAGLTRLAGFATPILLIYDNVESPEALRDLLPTTGARVLMTTRWTDWAGRAAEIKLNVLGEDAAAQFLQTRATRVDVPGAIRLANALGCLPLALDHAGAYCRLAGTSLTFDAYRNKIDTRITRAPKGYPESVALTFSIAIERAAAEHMQAETLLGIFAFLAPECIPLDLITEKFLQEDDRTEALMALSAVSLVEHRTLDDGSPAVTLHRLVQAAMRAQLLSQARTTQIVEMVLNCLLEAVPEGAYDEPRHWAQCAKLLPHVLAFHGHALAAGVQSMNFALLSNRIGEFLYARASLDLSKAFFSHAIDAGKSSFGVRHVAVANSMNNLANVLQEIGPGVEAEHLLREALSIQIEVLGTKHPSYARTLTSLSALLHDQGRLDEAESLLRDAIALGERTIGRTHPDVSMRIGNLATLLRSRGQLAQAEELYRESIHSGETSLGRGHPQVLIRLSSLALVLQAEGRLKEAEGLYLEAIESGEKSLGPDHPHLAICLQNLANLLRDAGRTTEAERLYVRALTIFEERIGEDHINTARVRSNFAKLLLATDRAHDAKELAEAALSVHKKILGPDHPWTQDSIEIISGALDALS